MVAHVKSFVVCLGYIVLFSYIHIDYEQDMDYGDDPVLSSMYAQENAAAGQMVSPAGLHLLQSLKDRRSWSKQSLEQLRDKLVTPAMMVAAGMKWSALQNKFGADALVNYGFCWEDMLAAGFNGRSLRSVTPALLARLGVNATRALQCRPRAEDIAALRLDTVQLKDMGWTLDMFKSIGLNHINMIQFGFPLRTWAASFALNDFKSLGFSNYSACALAGWSETDIQLALSHSGRRMTANESVVTTSRAASNLQFV